MNSRPYALASINIIEWPACASFVHSSESNVQYSPNSVDYFLFHFSINDHVYQSSIASSGVFSYCSWLFFSSLVVILCANVYVISLNMLHTHILHSMVSFFSLLFLAFIRLLLYYCFRYVIHYALHLSE